MPSRSVKMLALAAIWIVAAAALVAAAAPPVATEEEIARVLTETDVYIKYGLHDKAIEHLPESRSGTFGSFAAVSEE